MPARCRVALAGLGLAAAVAVAVLLPGRGEGAQRHAVNRAFTTSLVSQCVRAKHPSRVPALGFDATALAFTLAAGHEPGTRPHCRRDELRLSRLQTLLVGGVRTYVRRGGCQLPCVVRQATVHVPASALAGRVKLLPISARNGDGAPVAGCDTPAHNAPQNVERALRRMYYKTPAELRARRNAGRSGGDGARWSNYGDPGATYPGPGGAVTHYGYLLWNLPRTARGLLPGGGIVEAILPAGVALTLCAGERLRLPAYDVRGVRNGAVDFGYARVRNAGGPGYAIYGWVLLGYRYARRPYVATALSP